MKINETDFENGKEYAMSEVTNALPTFEEFKKQLSAPEQFEAISEFAFRQHLIAEPRTIGGSTTITFIDRKWGLHYADRYITKAKNSRSKRLNEYLALCFKEA